MYPGEYIEVADPSFKQYDEEIAIEPRSDSPHNGEWPPPTVTRVVNGTVRIPNCSEQPIFLARNQHFGQINRVICSSSLPSASISSVTSNDVKKNLTISPPYSDVISIDPENQLSRQQQDDFKNVCRKYDSVFNPNYKEYNDKSGVIRAHITIGSVPPPSQKARLPFYNQKNLQLLQQKADELEDKGVLVPPESVGLVPLHVSPSFLLQG